MQPRRWEIPSLDRDLYSTSQGVLLLHSVREGRRQAAAGLLRISPGVTTPHRAGACDKCFRFYKEKAEIVSELTKNCGFFLDCVFQVFSGLTLVFCVAVLDHKQPVQLFIPCADLKPASPHNSSLSHTPAAAMGLLTLSFSGLLCSSQPQQQKPKTAWPCPRCGDNPLWHPAHGQDMSREDRHWDGVGPDGAAAERSQGCWVSWKEKMLVF